MRSSNQATSLLFPELHERLEQVAKHQGTSLEELVRKACEVQYGQRRALSMETRLEAVRRLANLSLPVGDPVDMERESVPRPDDLLP